MCSLADVDDGQRHSRGRLVALLLPIEASLRLHELPNVLLQFEASAVLPQAPRSAFAAALRGSSPKRHRERLADPLCYFLPTTTRSPCSSPPNFSSAAGASASLAFSGVPRCHCLSPGRSYLDGQGVACSWICTAWSTAGPSRSAKHSRAYPRGPSGPDWWDPRWTLLVLGAQASVLGLRFLWLAGSR